MKIKLAKLAKQTPKRVENATITAAACAAASTAFVPMIASYTWFGVKKPVEFLIWLHQVRQVGVYRFSRRTGGPYVDMVLVDGRAQACMRSDKGDAAQVVLNDLQVEVNADPNCKFVVPEVYQWQQTERVEVKREDGTSYDPKRYEWIRKYTCTRLRPATSTERDMHLPLIALGPAGLFRRSAWALYMKLYKKQQALQQLTETETKAA